MNQQTIQHDEVMVITAMLRASRSEAIKFELSQLNHVFSNKDYQLIADCYSESQHEQEPITAALKRRLIQAGHDPLEHTEALELARIQRDLPPMGLDSVEEIADAVDRLNRSDIAIKATEILTAYHAQTYSYQEALETLKAIGPSETDSRGMVNLEDMVVAFENWTPPELLQFGFPKLDKFCKGIQRRRMTVLAARPGVGKSDLALHIVRANLEAGRNVFIATLEMDNEEIAHRLGKAEGVGSTWKEVVRSGLRKLNEWPGQLRVFDEGSQSVAQIAARTRNTDDLVVVDYMQILRPRTKSAKRYEIVTELSNDLRAAAKRSNAAWLVLSQLSRQARSEKDCPTLADLRESGAIEQDAHAVVFLYEPDGIAEDAKFQGVRIDVQKNRGGGLAFLNAMVNRPAHTWEEA